jgi:menaquinone-specific isochorismate synthase
MLKLSKFVEFLNRIDETKLTKQQIVRYIQPIDTNYYNSIIYKLEKSRIFFYWNKPSAYTSFLCFDQMVNASKKLHHANLFAYDNIDAAKLEWLPIVVGGSKFPSNNLSEVWEDFDESNWFIPKYIFYTQFNESFIVVNINSQEITDNKEKIIEEVEKFFNFESDESFGTNENYELKIVECTSFEEWDKIVNESINNIRNNFLSKVVLARCKKIEISPKPNIISILKKLETEFSDCYLFAFKKNQSLLFGATPEQLMLINNNIIETEALAGTIQRGKTLDEDSELVSKLIQDPKELTEHNSVLEYLLNVLKDFSKEIVFDSKPKIKKQHFMQHLWSQIKATLDTKDSLFTILDRLYPTPAICGMPKETALKQIDLLENFERGMYAGLIGWFNNSGHGDFAVAIRSALLKENFLYAFAGCGIVDGSISSQEFNETELKFKPILTLFENETTNQS